MAKAERRGLALGRKKQTRAKRKRHLELAERHKVGPAVSALVP